MRDLQGRIRDARTDLTKDREVLDPGESAEVDTQGDIGFALIQLKADTLHTIDIALRRLEDDTYGVCVDCGAKIAERRLRALPFAVRCRDCEDVREAAGQRERPMPRGASSSLALAMFN
jgi:DnaK suppressor protein